MRGKAKPVTVGFVAALCLGMVVFLAYARCPNELSGHSLHHALQYMQTAKLCRLIYRSNGDRIETPPFIYIRQDQQPEIYNLVRHLPLQPAPAPVVKPDYMLLLTVYDPDRRQLEYDYVSSIGCLKDENGWYRVPDQFKVWVETQEKTLPS